MGLRPIAGGVWPISSMIESIAASRVDEGRDLRRSRPAEPSRTQRTMPWSRSLKVRSWDQSMKTLRWRVWPATSCCWATRPGASRAWRWARYGWKMPMEHRLTFPSGVARRLRGRQSFQLRWPALRGDLDNLLFSGRFTQHPSLSTSLASTRVRPGSARRAAGYRVCAGRQGCAWNRADAADDRRGAVLR